jgi:mannose-6-phosphate isomerase
MIKLIEQPWGYEELFAQTNNYVGKIIFIKQGYILSLQYHKYKEETIRVLKGTLTFVLGDQTFKLFKGESVHVSPNTVHRMEAHEGDVTVIEVSTPQVDDFVNIVDYHKISTNST